jgi:aryl-alcohol dehydrogenase-like predicted oxidoreductase
LTPVEETLRALDDLVRAGKVRYIGCSNHAGWHLMKALATSDRCGLARYVGQQINYSLVARDAEHELIPLGLDQGVGVLVWSPLQFGLLSGKFRRNIPAPQQSRLNELDQPGTIDHEQLYRIVDVLDAIAKERGKTVPQVALNWLLRKPCVANVILGVRNETQLHDLLGATSFALTVEEVGRLDQVSVRPEPYPYWHQHKYGAERNPPLPSVGK